MFHRESGYYKTSYAADMALYPLPVARWAVIAIAVLLCAAPFALHQYYVSTINLVPWISGGVQASIEVPRPALFGMELRTQHQLYWFLLFFAVVAVVGTLNLVRSRIGRAFIAIRDQDIAAEIIGINIFRYKL